jgi:hypothetical protein
MYIKVAIVFLNCSHNVVLIFLFHFIRIVVLLPDIYYYIIYNSIYMKPFREFKEISTNLLEKNIAILYF